MKNRYILAALLCASAFSFIGCIEENFETPTPAKDGDEIVFGARAGYENSGAETRTIYTGETYPLNGKTFERIDWIDGQDEIQIFCTEAGGPNPSNYTINHWKDHDTEKDYAYLTKKGDNSLSWSGDDEHHFYAMYPAQSLFADMETTLAQGIKMEGTTLHGIVPAAQPATVTQNGLHWVAAPDMKYAYMAAKSTASRADGNVSLTFVPIVTAVQVQMVLSSESIEPISIAEIVVAGDGISGAFTADLSETGWPEGQTYPTCTNVGAGNGAITISTWIDNKPITIEAGGSLTFTVFLRPGADYKNLKVSYSPTGAGYIGKTMGSNTNPVNLPRNLKTVVNGFKLPAAKKEEEVITVDASKWMTQVADEIDFKKLSIPGTGGSFSYNYTADTDGYFRSQHTYMTIPEQWKVGIRAFEIVSDRIESGGFFGWGASPASLAGTPVTCNKNSVGINVGAAMEQINNQLNANPQECAVVIFTYQPEGASPGRDATKYAQSLKLWFDGINYKDKFVLYRPDITLGEVRGKILVIVRLNQSGENDGGSFSNAVSQLPVATYPFLLVDGCGTAKDKWGARGYTIDGSPAPNISNSASTYIEQYMQSATIDPTNHSNVARGSMNFAYKTNTAAECWYHEWARVLPGDLSIASGRWNSYSHPAMYWFESYTEKLSNAVETFKMAISDEFSGEGDDVDYVFVNTLSGYMATEATKGSPTYSLVPSVGSAYGGDGGDIDALATRLNSDFYREVLGAGMEQATGPTGVVMMDYVNNKPTEGVEFDGSYYLPGVIIANNFKYGSGNSGNTGGTTGGGNGNGDNNTETPGGGNEEEGM